MNPNPLREHELHAYADGQLDEFRKRAVQQEIERDPAKRRQVDMIRRQKALLRHAYSQEGMPPGLCHLIHEYQSRTRYAPLKLAASFMVGTLLGAVLMAQWPTSPPAPAAEALAKFPQRAAVAHAVYSPEVRHPVEVAANERDHLVMWLSKRLDKPIQIPEFSAQGFGFVGGRLLPGDQGPTAQFMFQDGGNRRVTLYVAPRLGGGEGTAQYVKSGAIGTIYWFKQNSAYALSGELPQLELDTIAQSARQQLAR